MIQLFSSIYTTDRPTANILVIGPSGSGKTTIVEKLKLHFTGACMQNIQPTIGMNLAKFPVQTGRMIDVALWDLGGAKGLRSLWQNYFQEANGVLLVIDGSAGKNSEAACENLEIVRGLIKEHSLTGKPILIMSSRFGDVELRLDEVDEGRSVKFVNVDDVLGMVKGLVWLVGECVGR